MTGETVEANRQQGDRTKSRTARLNHNADGDPLGCMVFFGSVELRALGIDPTRATVDYWIEDGEVRFSIPDTELTGL